MRESRTKRIVRSALRSGIAAVLICLGNLSAEAQTIGNSIVSFAQSKLNARVGGGECAHLATEALRASGGEFVPSDLGADSPSTGDYVWGTLVTTIAYANKARTDSNPTNLAQPGDIIQYYAATFTYSKTSIVKTATRHTSIIAAVNAAGRPTSIYQQNFNSKRFVQTATIDVTKLTAGWIRIYRPKARLDRTSQWKVTVVNNASTSQTYTIVVGTSTISTITLTAANTTGSFKVQNITTSGTVPCLVLSNGQSIYLETAKGDEIYNPTTGAFAVRQLSL